MKMKLQIFSPDAGVGRAPRVRCLLSAGLAGLIIPLSLVTTSFAADLPTVTVEHLYYLQARAERLNRFKPDQMVEYCIAQKLGGAAFESVYAQLFAMRLELVKLIEVDRINENDPRVITLNQTVQGYRKLLYEEVEKVQSGILAEGRVASDALSSIAAAQNAQRTSPQ